MRITLIAAVALAAGAVSTTCCGHGMPVEVNVVGEKLTVSGGVADAVGYANWIFADPDPESWLQPISATEQFTELPGIRFNDVNAGTPISLEVISRPDLSEAAHPQRWLWHWNLAGEKVDESLNDPAFAILSQDDVNEAISLKQWTAPTDATIKITDLAGGDVGQHRHFFAYFLDDSPAAPAGVYGFFARLIAPGYQSSEPFLVALNLNVFDMAKFQDGAREINVTAGLAGDFDVDGDVDGSDFLQWQRELGAAGTYPPADGSLSGSVDSADLAVWKSQFGEIVELPAAAAIAGTVPEPSTLALATILTATFALRRISRTGCRE
ncbi:MAG: hypothetical protein H0T51_10640 [Pirellulales bacterium]|nr:hypothetical protein [Pirellulales bacterium]